MSRKRKKKKGQEAELPGRKRQVQSSVFLAAASGLAADGSVNPLLVFQRKKTTYSPTNEVVCVSAPPRDSRRSGEEKRKGGRRGNPQASYSLSLFLGRAHESCRFIGVTVRKGQSGSRAGESYFHLLPSPQPISRSLSTRCWTQLQMLPE